MGQQQLLLVILVTVIVGIATVVAINIFGTGADQANRDAIRQDLLVAAGQAQALWARPSAMGGFGRAFPADIDIRQLNIPRGSDATMTYTEDEIVNDNGSYTLTASGTGTESTMTITGVPNSGGDNIQVQLDRTSDASGDIWVITWPTEEGED